MKLSTLTMMHDAAVVLRQKFGLGTPDVVSAEELVKKLVDMPESERQRMLHSVDALVRGLGDLEKSCDVTLTSPKE